MICINRIIFLSHCPSNTMDEILEIYKSFYDKYDGSKETKILFRNMLICRVGVKISRIFRGSFF